MKLTLTNVVGWGIIAVIGAFVLLAVLASLDDWIFEVPFYLVTGWFFYLKRTLHEITWNWEAIISGLVFLVLSVGGFHLVARSIASSRGQTWRWGWSARISCLLLLVFGTSLAIGGITHQTVWLARGDKLVTRSSGQIIEHVNRARNVTQMVKLFAEKNNGRHPALLEELITSGFWDDLQSFERITWYTGVGGPPAQWIYVRGLSDTAPGDLPLLIAPRTFSQGRRIIATNDGSVELLKQSNIRESLPNWKEEYAAIGLPLPTVLEEYEQPLPEK